MRPSIVITGYGSITALGVNSELAQENNSQGLVNNRVLGHPVFPKGFEAPCFLVEKELLQPFKSSIEYDDTSPIVFNRTILLALTAIEETIGSSGWGLGDLRSKRVGVIMGTTVGCTFHNEEYYTLWKKGEKPQSAPLTTYLSSNLSERIQKSLHLSGPRAVITNACASGTDAIGIGKNWLEHDLCDLVIAGGSDELSRVASHGFKSLMLVSQENCKPFDQNRQGLNLGEGAGVFLLEREDKSLERGGIIYGRVKGYGIGGDAYHPTGPHPEGRGLQLAFRNSLKNSGVGIDSIAMINGHGTGTPANDLAETTALAGLGFDTLSVPVVSTKGTTGHTLGAAGGVEAVYTLMALNKGEVFGTTGCCNQDDKLPLDVLAQGQKKSLKSRIGVSQSLAFGGSNSVLILEGVGA